MQIPDASVQVFGFCRDELRVFRVQKPFAGDEHLARVFARGRCFA
jgi:hypothetical protein